MNVLYCGDRNIEDGLIISILSLLKNIDEELKIYVLTINYKDEKRCIESVTDKVIDFMNNKVQEINENSFVKKIEITKLFKKEIPIENMDTRFTPCCMLRLFADELPELPDKILYLDNDVVCRKSCLDFYNQNMEEYEISGVLDYYGKWFFKKNIFKFDYLNSGVLLLNLKKIKETKLFQKSRQMCINKKMFMPDQSALNKLSIAKKINPRIYNEQRKLHKDTVLQHFTTSFRLYPILHTVTIKPWHIDKLHNKLKIFEYDNILAEYQNIKQSINEKTEELI